MRRGFNLFAAFIGTAMLLIAIGFSIYANQQRINRSNQIALNLVTYDTRGVATVIKADAYNTVLNTLRKNFQAFFSSTTITVPSNYLGSCDLAEKWFERDFAQTDQFASWVADQMVLALQKYGTANIYGSQYTISVIVNKEKLTEAIKRASEINMNRDGTFTYIIDTSKLSEKDYLSLPKIMVSEELGSGVTGSTTDVVLPRGKWAVHIPLRVGTALCYASTVYNYLKDKKDLVALAVGHCYKKNPALCGVFTGSGKLLFPRMSGDLSGVVIRSTESKEPIRGSIVDACQYQRIEFLKGENLTPNYSSAAAEGVEISNGDVVTAITNALQSLEGYYEILLSASGEAAQGIDKEAVQEKLDEIKSCLGAVSNCSDTQCKIKAITGDACSDIVGELQWTPCSGSPDSAGIYLAVVDSALQRNLQENLQSAGVTISPDLENYERIETAAEVSRTGINILEIVCQELTGTASAAASVVNIVLKLLGIGEELPTNFCTSNNKTVNQLFEHTTVSYGPCTVSNYVYCFAPKTYSTIVNWADPDKKYWIDKSYPPSYHIRIIFGQDTPPVTTNAKAMKDKVEGLSLTAQDKNKDFTCKVYGNLKQNLPQYTESTLYSCLANYTYAYVQEHLGKQGAERLQQCVEALQFYGQLTKSGGTSQQELPDFITQNKPSGCGSGEGKELVECWIKNTCNIDPGDYDKDLLASNTVADLCYALEGLGYSVPGIYSGGGAQRAYTCYGPVTPNTQQDGTYYFCGEDVNIQEQTDNGCPEGYMPAETQGGEVCLAGDESLLEQIWKKEYLCTKTGEQYGGTLYSCYPRNTQAGFCDTFYPKPGITDKIKNWVDDHIPDALKNIVKNVYGAACKGPCEELSSSTCQSPIKQIWNVLNPKNRFCLPYCTSEQHASEQFEKQLVYYAGSNIQEYLNMQESGEECYQVQNSDGTTAIVCGGNTTPKNGDSCQNGTYPVVGGQLCVSRGKEINPQDGWSCTAVGGGVYNCIKVGTSEEYCEENQGSLYCQIYNAIKGSSGDSSEGASQNSPLASLKPLYIFNGGSSETALQGPGAQCYPPLMGQMIVQMAAQLVSGQVCNATPRDAVVYNTLWLHIGSEIYASCSTGGQIP